MREVSLPPEHIRSTARGINEVRDRVPVLTRIEVHYELTIPAGSREKLDRALATHVDKCPTAQSLRGAVEIEWTADITEEG